MPTLPTEEQLSTPEFKAWYANLSAAPRDARSIDYMGRHIPESDSANPAYSMALEAFSHSLYPPRSYVGSAVAGEQQISIVFTDTVKKKTQ
jgi:hypothetical protein